jgi:hypothetical protein
MCSCSFNLKKKQARDGSMNPQMLDVFLKINHTGKVLHVCFLGTHGASRVFFWGGDTCCFLCDYSGDYSFDKILIGLI